MRRIWKGAAAVLLMLPLAVMPVTVSSSEAPKGQRKPAAYQPLQFPPGELAYGSPEAMLADMEPVAQDGVLRLYFNSADGNVAIKRDDTGAIFSANPYDADAGPVSGDNLQKLKSQVTVAYYDLLNNMHWAFSHGEAVMEQQAGYRLTGDGVAVEFSIGSDPEKDILPQCLPRASLDAVKDALGGDAQAREFIDLYYSAVALNQITSHLPRAEYTNDKSKNAAVKVYVLSGLRTADRKRMTAYFEQAGYTKEKQSNDLLACGISLPREESFFVTLEVEYALRDGCFTASVPTGSLHYNTNAFFIERINLLPFFASSTKEQAPGGYLFIPDGGGAVIRFDDATRDKPAVISQRLYQMTPPSATNTVRSGGWATGILSRYSARKQTASA